MNPFKEFEVDPTKANEGVRVEIKSRDGAGSMFFLMRRAGTQNREYRFAMAKHAQKHKRDLREQISDDGKKRALALQDQLLRETFADSIILGWEGVDGRDGQPLEFTRENVLDLLTACPDLWDELQVAAVDIERFKPNGAGADGAEVGKP